MPGLVTDAFLDYIRAPEEKRAHLVRRDSIRELGNGLVEGVTLCGKRIVGYPSRDPRPALCQHCVLARLNPCNGDDLNDIIYTPIFFRDARPRRRRQPTGS